MRLFGRQRKSETPAVEISEKDGVRYLHLGGPAIQSAMRIREPYALHLEYTRAMMMFLLLLENPGEICLIGLGGGSIAKYIHHYLPVSRLLALEVSADVVAAARGYFLLPDDDDRLQVRIGDGAAHVHANKASMDVLLVDGYDANRIVEALATESFYRACRDALKPRGVAVFNLWGSDRFFDTYLSRIETAFEGRVLQLPAERKGNIQIFALAESASLPSLAVLRERAKALDQHLDLGGVRMLDRLLSCNPGMGQGFAQLG